MPPKQYYFHKIINQAAVAFAVGIITKLVDAGEIADDVVRGSGRRSTGKFARFAQMVRKPNWPAAQASQPLEETNKISIGWAEYFVHPS